MAGLWNKDKEFWEYLERSDFISLSETWIEEKNEKFYKEGLSKNFEWKFIGANRVRRKGRAMGGFLIGVKKDWLGDGHIVAEKKEEGLIKTYLGGKEEITIWSVYNSGHIEKYWAIWEEIDLLEENKIVIGGDFNIRIGELGGLGSREEEELCRKSKDKTVGNGGKNMVEFVSKKGWLILNGSEVGDEEGEFTFIGARGSSVIDYVVVNQEMKEIVTRFELEGRVESNHTPVTVTIRIDNELNRGKRRSRGWE